MSCPLSIVPSAVHLHGPFFLQNFSFSVIPFHRNLNTRFLAQFKLGTTLYSTCCIFILKLSCISFIYHIKKKSNPLCFKKMLQKEYAYCKRKPNNSEEKILYHVSPIFYPCHPKQVQTLKNALTHSHTDIRSSFFFKKGAQTMYSPLQCFLL